MIPPFGESALGEWIDQFRAVGTFAECTEIRIPPAEERLVPSVAS